MMDSLIQFLLEEIAMDGDEGSDVSRLNSFVATYYTPAATTGPGPILKSSSQKLDNDFLTYVWNRLIEQDEVRIAVIEAIEEEEKENEESVEDAPKKGKGKAKAKIAEPTECLRNLTEEELETGKDALVEKFGNDLRIVTSEDATWAAITGSHERLSAITAPVYSILQMVSRSRGKGATVIEVGRTLGIDQKSVFHFVRVGVTLGIMKKFRTIDAGAWTNRLLHIRYLSVSPEWAIFTTNDVVLDSDVAQNSSDDDAGRGSRFPKIGPEFLTENTELVKKRILKVLKGRPDYIMPRIELPESIALYGISRKDRRLLNSIVDRLADSGLVLKVITEQPAAKSSGRTHELVSVHYLQLTDAGLKTFSPADGASDEEEPEEMIENYPALLGNIPWERQILDLLGEADVEGMRNKDLAFALGGINRRTVDQALNRIGKDNPPGHLLDLTVNSVFETIGREKFLKYFLRPAYLRRILRDGLTEKEAGVDIAGLGSAGGWSELEAIGTYDKVKDLDDFISGININQQTGGTSSFKGLQNIKSKPKVVRKVSSPKAKKVTAAKASSSKKVPKSSATSESTPVVKAPTKKLVAPVPKVLKLGKDGKPSYYARMQQEKKDREAAGLPPKLKRAPSLGGRKKKVVPGEEGEKEVEKEVADGMDVDDSAKEASVGEDIVPPPVAPSPSPSNSAPVVSTSKLQPTPAAVASTSSTTDFDAPVSTTSKSKAKGKGKGKGKAVESIKESEPLDSSPAQSSPALPSPAAAEPKSAPTKKDKGKAKEVIVVESKKRPATQLLDSAPPLKRVTPSSAVPAPASNSKPRKSSSLKPKKVNITVLSRQKELLAYLEAHGGVAEKNRHLAEKMAIYFKSLHPETLNGQMDWKILGDCVSTLEERGALKTTVSLLEANNRKDIIYLPSIDGDSPQMKEFLENLKGIPRGPRNSIRISYVAEESKEDDGTFIAPEEGDDDEQVQMTFESHSGVLGARFGVYYGRFARAKELDLFLMSFVTSGEAGQYLVEGTESSPTVVTTATFFEAVPLGIWLKLIPLPIEISSQFDEFIAEDSNLALPMNILPKEIRKIIQPKLSKRKDHMYTILRTLVELGFLQPLLSRAYQGGVPGRETFDAAKLAARASHWLIQPLAPVYTFGATEPRLIRLNKIDSLETAEAHWDELMSNSVHYSKVEDVLPTIEDERFPSIFDGYLATKKLIKSSTKWCSSYMLLDCQRAYLTKLTRRGENPLNIETVDEDELEAIGKRILAPVTVIREFLVKQKNRQKNSSFNVGALRVKKRKVGNRKAKIGGAGEEEEEEDEEEEDEDKHEQVVPARSKAASKLALAEKSKEITLTRESIFQSILERFMKAHDNPVIETKYLDYLRRRFTSATAGIGTKILESEFRYFAKIDEDSTYSTIVPQSVQKASNDYEIPARKKSKAVKIKPKVVAQKAAPRGGVVGTGDQKEFLTMPILPVPNLVSGQRLPRNFFTPEQNDLCLDAAAILKCRSALAVKTIAWEPMSQLFTGLPAGKMRQLSVRLTEKTEDKNYFERLMIAWEEVYKNKIASGELVDENIKEMIQIDLASFVRCLRANVDKASLRLAGPLQKGAGKVKTLPATLELLQEKYRINFTAPALNPETKFSFYLNAVGNSAREDALQGLAFSAPVMKQEEEFSHKIAIAIAKVKMILVTPVQVYSEDTANTLLEASRLDIQPAHQKLMVDNVIARKTRDSARFTPGTNFAFTKSFLRTFDYDLPKKQLESMEAMKQKLLSSKSEKLPIVLQNAEMRSILLAFSKNQVDFEVDTEPSAYLRNVKEAAEKKDEPENEVANEIEPEKDPQKAKEATLGHKKFSDISIELDVIVTAKASDADDVLPIAPITPVPIELSTDRALLHTTFEQFLAGKPVDEVAELRILSVLLASAGSKGLTLTELLHKSKSNRSVILNHLAQVTSTTPPLAFWVGNQESVIVSAGSAADWTVTIGGEENRRAILPALWIDIHGNVVEEFWQRTKGFLQKFLEERPGSTCSQIFAKAKVRSILTMGEIMFALRALESNLVRRDEESAIDWEESRWYVVEE